MFTKKKLLCSAATFLAIVGMAGMAHAGQVTQTSIRNAFTDGQFGGVKFTGNTGYFSFLSGTYSIRNPNYVDTTQSDLSQLDNNYSLLIESGVTLEVSGGLDRNDPDFENMGLLNVTELKITGGNLIAKGSDDPSFTKGSYAVDVHNHLYQTGGVVDVTGGAGLSAWGMGVVFEYNMSGGTLKATGGEGLFSNGLIIGTDEDEGPERDLELTGGDIIAKGGIGNSANGIYILGSVNMYNGTITANGGDGITAHGLVSSNDFFQMDGRVITTGGGTAGKGAAGLAITQSYIMVNGSLEAHGGAIDNHGVIAGGFSQEGGTITTKGTGGGVGIFITGFSGNEPVFKQTGGTLNAYGELGEGLVVLDASSNGKFIQNSMVNAYGGTDSSTFGIMAGNEYQLVKGTLNTTGGTLTASGIVSGNHYTAGVYTKTFTQEGGMVNAYGGGGLIEQVGTDYFDDPSGTAGLMAAEFIQKAGMANAFGGEAGTTDAYGMFVDDFKIAVVDYITDADGDKYVTAKFSARGGAGTNAYGLYVDNIGNINPATVNDLLEVYSGATLDSNSYGAYFTGDLTIEDLGELYFGRFNESGNAADNPRIAASLKVDGNLTFASGSTISPIVNLGQGIAGLIEVGSTGAETLTIGSGVELEARFANTRKFEKGTILNGLDVINVYTGTTVTGNFTNEGVAQETLFFKYTVNNDGSGNYTIDGVERKYDMEEVTANLGENAQNLINGVANGLANATIEEILTNETLSMLNNMYDELENSSDFDEFYDMATFAQMYLTNHGGTRLAHYSMQQLDVVQNAMNREILHAQKLPYWQAWGKGIFHNTSSVKAKTNEFVKGKEDYSGIVIGVARDFRYVTFAGQAHYLTGTVKSQNLYKADTDAFGFIVGARIHDVVNPKATFNPWFDINFAYSHMNADQKRSTLTADSLGYLDVTSAKSKAKSDMFRIGMAVGNTFDLGGWGTISPQIGFEYTHFRQDGYSEHSDGLALRTGKTTFESLRPKIGAEAEIYLSDFVSADFRAFYYYETMDQRMIYNNSFTGAPGVNFKTKGEKLNRSSANLGVGLNVMFDEQVSAGIAYDMWLRDKYMAHQFAVELRFNF